MEDKYARESALVHLADLWDSLPFELLLVGHCVLVASWFIKLRDRFLFSYWVGLFAAFGGGTITSLLIQDPKRAPIALFADNRVGITWTVVWWLVNYSPGNVGATLANLLPVRVLAKAASTHLRASLMCSRTALGAELYPGVLAAPLVLGTLGGTGGKFVGDVLLGGTGPYEVSSPTWVWRSGALGSLAYLLLVHQGQVVAPWEGKALVLTFYIAHAVLSELLARPLDWTLPLARMAHALGNVPMPGLQPVGPSKSRVGGPPESKKKR